MIVSAHYNPGFVVASILIAIATAYCALDVAPRIQAHKGFWKWFWIGMASFCLGGGIWSMHFVAMLAYNPFMPVYYDIKITVLSFLLPIVTAAIGFPIIHHERTLEWNRAMIVGAIFGVSICAMHYTGMYAMRTDGVMHWDPFLIFVSYVIAAGASIAAIRTSFTQPTPLKHMVGAGLLGAAISGMHYTGMAAMTMTMGGGSPAATGALDPTGLGTTVAFVAMAILGLTTFVANVVKGKE